jgi:hypothetical protein
MGQGYSIHEECNGDELYGVLPGAAQKPCKDMNGIYCASAHGDEFSEYTILQIKDDSVQLEVIIPTVGLITYYGKGVITKRTKQKIEFEFTRRNDPHLESCCIYDLEENNHYYLKDWQEGEIMLCQRYKGKVYRTILHTEHCNCLIKEGQIGSFILKTRTF